jgi:hypothetical protein
MEETKESIQVDQGAGKLALLTIVDEDLINT